MKDIFLKGKAPQSYITSNNKRTNNKRTNNKELIYICGDESTPNASPEDSSLRSIRDASPSVVPQLDLIYKSVRQKIRSAEKIFFLSCSVSSKPGKRNKLNIDIIPEPGDKPSKYICSLAPYKHKHGVYQNMPAKTKSWSAWDKSKDLYAELKDDAAFGKFVQRTTYTKTLSRTIAPGMLGGTVFKDNTLFAVLYIYDKEYWISLSLCKDPTDEDKSGLHYFAKGTHQEDWEEGHYNDDELDGMDEL